VSRPSGLRRFVGPPGQPGQPASVQSPVARPQPGQLGSPGQPGPAQSQPARPDQAPGPGERPAPGERCEFCATGVGPTHSHIADLEQSSLMCACRACYLLFTQPSAGRGRYRSVPDRYLHDSSRPLSVAEWDELQIPVGLAFFLYRSQRGELEGFYPSPAGATQCTLDLPAWARLAAAHPLLASAEHDVEAVLICRAESGVDCFIVPIDACYELAGRMRMLWRGFDGGAEARASIEDFLAGVRRRAKDVAQGARHG